MIYFDERLKIHTNLKTRENLVQYGIQLCFTWHRRGAVHSRVVVLAWSTVLEGQKPTQGQACTAIPFHIVSTLLSMQIQINMFLVHMSEYLDK